MRAEILVWADRQCRRSGFRVHSSRGGVLDRSVDHRFAFLTGLAAIGTGTANEIAKAYLEANKERRISTEQIRKKASALVARGDIEIIGSRRCDVSGRQCAVYRAITTDKG